MTDKMTDKKFMQLCKDIVAEYVNDHLDKTDKIDILSALNHTICNIR